MILDPTSLNSYPKIYPDGTIVTKYHKYRKQLPMATYLAISKDGELSSLISEKIPRTIKRHRERLNTISYQLEGIDYTAEELVYITYVGPLNKNQTVTKIDESKPISPENLEVVSRRVRRFTLARGEWNTAKAGLYKDINGELVFIKGSDRQGHLAALEKHYGFGYRQISRAFARYNYGRPVLRKHPIEDDTWVKFTIVGDGDK